MQASDGYDRSNSGSRRFYYSAVLDSRGNRSISFVGSRLNPAALGREGETKIHVDIPDLQPLGRTDNGARHPLPLRPSPTVYPAPSAVYLGLSADRDCRPPLLV